MKIALISDLFYPLILGGGEKRYWEFARRLARNHEVRMLTSRTDKLPAYERIEGVEVHRVWPLREGLYTPSGRRKITTSLSFAKSILLNRELLRGVDIVDVNAFPILHCPIVKWNSRRVSSGPVITTVHEYWGQVWYDYASFPIAAAGMAMESWIYSLSDFLLPVSEFTSRRLGDGSRVLSVVPSGVDLSFTSELEGVPQDNEVIAVGRLVPNKRFQDLIMAIALLKKRGMRIHLTIIGEGPEGNRLTELIGKLGLDAQVDLLRGIWNPRFILTRVHQAQVFVLPSIREGQGIAIIEAMSVGTPVIVAAHPQSAAPFLVRHRDDGLLVPPLRPDKIADAIHLLLEDTELRGKLGQAALQKARKYDWDELTKKLERVYSNALDRHLA